MLIAFGRFWSWWTESWRSARRARVQYVAIALAFGALAVIAALMSEPLVAAVAGVAAAICLALAMLAARLLRWTSSQEAHER
jgi:uncharacterized membrane protein